MSKVRIYLKKTLPLRWNFKATLSSVLQLRVHKKSPERTMIFGTDMAAKELFF